MLTYLLMAVICGYCAYHAIGKGGYIALLAAITVVITAGHGNQNVYDALWRTVDVFIGTAIALVFSFALPAYASYSWRVRLASLLRASAAVHVKMRHGFADAAEQRAAMLDLGAKLIPLRGLIPSVAKETGVPAAEFEEIQHAARVCVSALELMAAIEQESGPGDGDDPGIASALLALADALETGRAPAPAVSPAQPAVVPAPETGPLAFMASQLAAEIGRLRAQLDRMSEVRLSLCCALARSRRRCRLAGTLAQKAAHQAEQTVFERRAGKPLLVIRQRAADGTHDRAGQHEGLDGESATTRPSTSRMPAELRKVDTCGRDQRITAARDGLFEHEAARPVPSAEGAEQGAHDLPQPLVRRLSIRLAQDRQQFRRQAIAFALRQFLQYLPLVGEILVERADADAGHLGNPVGGQRVRPLGRESAASPPR